MNHHWKDINYLSKGNDTQIKVNLILKDHGIMDRLQKYCPILVGTVPIEINVAGSDLDIICAVHDFDQFEEELNNFFSMYPEFTTVRRTVDGIERIKANFICENWPIEIFGQAIPTTNQNGYKHMIIEARLLSLYGKEFRKRIIDLKSSGIKTEPAFAQELQLEGNAFEELLKLYDYTDEELKGLWDFSQW